MRIVVYFPVAKVLLTKEARYVVLRSRVGVPVEASIGKCGRISLVRFRMWPLDTEGEGLGSGSLCDFSCEPERFLPLYRAKHWKRHFWVVVVVVVGGVGGWDLNASAADHRGGQRTEEQ